MLKSTWEKLTQPEQIAYSQEQATRDRAAWLNQFPPSKRREIVRELAAGWVKENVH